MVTVNPCYYGYHKSIVTMVTVNPCYYGYHKSIVTMATVNLWLLWSQEISCYYGYSKSLVTMVNSKSLVTMATVNLLLLCVRVLTLMLVHIVCVLLFHLENVSHSCCYLVETIRTELCGKFSVYLSNMYFDCVVWERPKRYTIYAVVKE